MLSFLKNVRGLITLSLAGLMVFFTWALCQQLPDTASITSVSLPRILSVTIATNGAVQMRIIGQALHHFLVETSTKLNSWSFLATNAFSAASEGSFVDTNMHNSDTTFYRVLQLESIAGASSTNTTTNRGIRKQSANDPPTVNLTSPTNNATFNAPVDIMLEANASDSDGAVTLVEFFAGSTLLGSDTSNPQKGKGQGEKVSVPTIVEFCLDYPPLLLPG